MSLILVILVLSASGISNYVYLLSARMTTRSTSDVLKTSSIVEPVSQAMIVLRMNQTSLCMVAESVHYLSSLSNTFLPARTIAIAMLCTRFFQDGTNDNTRRNLSIIYYILHVPK